MNDHAVTSATSRALALTREAASWWIKSFSSRALALTLFISGTLCLLLALAIAGTVAVALLDAYAHAPAAAGGCVGAELLPLALLAGSAFLGLFGCLLTTSAAVLFWRLSAPRG